MDKLKKLIRSVPDFPKKGIVFRDITTLLKDGTALREAVAALCAPFEKQKVDIVVGIESRGFILGAAVACKLGAGFVPVRKAGKLPAETVEESYALEYGTDRIAMHKDAIKAGQKVLMVDDLLATGGTMAASCRLVEKLGGKIIGCAFLIELSFLNGRAKLPECPIHVLIDYASEA
jgi:adenine phosphoribosyltransferase